MHDAARKGGVLVDETARGKLKACDAASKQGGHEYG